jgi:hypothetical protein
MAQTIWAVFEKSTGAFAGSGTPYYDDETYGSTEILPETPEGYLAFWDGEAWYYVEEPTPDDLP